MPAEEQRETRSDELRKHVSGSRVLLKLAWLNESRCGLCLGEPLSQQSEMPHGERHDAMSKDAETGCDGSPAEERQALQRRQRPLQKL